MQPNLRNDIATINTSLVTSVKQEDFLGETLTITNDIAPLVQAQFTATNANIATNATQIASLASGSPKNKFADLATLQSDATANTTAGKTSIYLVLPSNGVAEVDTLTVTTAPTTAGNVTVTLNGVATNVGVVIGVTESASLTVTAIPTVAGNITVTLNGVATTIAVDPATDTTTALVATKIRNTTYSTGSITGGATNIVTFLANAVGARTDAVFSGGATGTTGTMTVTVQGVDADTTTTVATKIRGTAFTGWTTSGTTTAVIFTKTTVGINSAPIFSAGTTGSVASFAITTVGIAIRTGDWYYWSGSAWTDGGVYQSSGIAAKAVDTSNVSDYIYNNIIQVEKIIGSNPIGATIDTKDLTLLTSAVGSRVNETRILETPATTTGVVTLFANFMDARSVDILIMAKGTGTQFMTIKRQTVNVVAGINNILTNLVISLGQYVGIYAYSDLYYRLTTKTSYVVAGNIDTSFVTTTSSTTFDLAYYYKIGGIPNAIDQNTSSISALNSIMLPSITTNYRDLTTFTSTTSDAGNGAFRINDQPATKNGIVTFNGNFSVSGNVDIYVFAKNINNSDQFKMVSMQTVAVAGGINQILTTLTIQTGQYVGLISKSNLKYIAGTPITHSLPYQDISNYSTFTKATTFDYGYYYSVAYAPIQDLQNQINNISVVPTPISINYSEKFIGSVLPIAPYGTWLTSGTFAINNGVTPTPNNDWNTYLYLNQRMNFNTEGIKFRVKINDLTSIFRIAKMASTTPTGFSTIAEYNNGVLNIYQTVLNLGIVPTQILVTKTIDFTLVAGREYVFTLEGFAEIVNLTIYDTVTALSNVLTYTSTNQGTNNAGRLWDYPTFYMYSGNVVITQFEYFTKIPKSPKVVVTGDSIVEADTIRNEVGGGYTNRCFGKLYTTLNGNVAILGTAGETSTGILQKINILALAFKSPEYALLCHFTNDDTFTTWQTNTLQLIALFQAKGAIPVICLMPARVGRETFAGQVVAWVLQSGYKYIDFAKALTTNGDRVTHNATYYLADNIHPNVAGHARMYQQISVDLGEIFAPIG
ncbi:MAG TPA: SGNH/GDSL hydrolase family protein [Clostridium sp.]